MGIIELIRRIILDIFGFLVGGNGITVTVVRGPIALTDCGSVEWEIRWGLNPMREGWIIQHIRFDTYVKDCENNPLVPKNPNGLEYWEAWRVSGGLIQWGGQDIFRTVDEGEGTKGKVIITGKVRFYEGYDLREPPWGHTVAPAGPAPTMTTEPDGVTDVGAMNHTLKVEWVCCPNNHNQIFTSHTREGGLPGLFRFFFRMPTFLLKTIPLVELSKIMKDPKINAIVEKINSMSAWADLAADDKEMRMKIINDLEQVSHEDITVIRNAMDAYIKVSEQKENKYNVSAMSKLYAINRYIFNVPEEVSPEKIRFGSFYNPNDSSKTIHSLWPLSFNEQRKLELSGVFHGYFGQSFLAIEEFDYFLKEYGRRN